MPTRRPHTQQWWRWSRYEINDGFIRPGPGGTLKRYDPWANYWRAADGGTRDQKAPYQLLVDLLATIEREDRIDDEQLGPVGARALLDWCADYGLLGLLPQQAWLVMLEPRLARPDSDLVKILARADNPRADPLADGFRERFYDDEPRPARGSYLRVGARWQALTHAVEAGGISRFRDARTATTELVLEKAASHPNFGWIDCGPLDRRNRIPPVWPPEACVLSTDISGPGWSMEPVGTGWATYFPGRRPDDPILPPLSEEFWQHYAEPVHGFLEGARHIRAAMAAYGVKSKPVARRRRTPASGVARAMTKMQESQALDALLSTVSPIVIRRGGAIEQRWVAPSLLATFAAMLMQDLSGGRTFRWCSECSGVFTSREHAAAYCSPTCRERAVKRRYRARKRRATHAP